MKVSFVIPCYNSQKTIRKLIDMTCEQMKMMEINDYEFVLVNDYSKDKTMDELRIIANKYKFVKVIDLANNFGQHNAIMAGLNYVEGDIVVGMDDDLQTHPSQLPKLFAKLDEGYDLVYGKYPDKKHSWFRNLGSKFNNWTVSLLLGKPKSLKACSFWVARKFVRDEVIKYKNPYTHLQGLFLRTTKNIANVDIEHFEREVGESNYTLKKLLKLWSSCTNFSILPLRIAIMIGVSLSIVGFFSAIIIVIRKILYPEILIGWSSIMVGILFFSGLNLLFIGLVGEYIGRIFISINNSPQYVIKKTFNIENDIIKTSNIEYGINQKSIQLEKEYIDG